MTKQKRKKREYIVFNIYALLGGPAEEIVGREQSEKLDIDKVKVVFQVFKIPVP